MDLNEASALARRLIEYAEADPPVRFVLSPGATAADLDEAVRIIGKKAVFVNKTENRS